MFVWHETSWMWMSMMAVLLLLAILAYIGIRSLIHPTVTQVGVAASALLDRRLARGEISPAEYRESRAALDAPGARRTKS